MEAAEARHALVMRRLEAERPYYVKSVRHTLPSECYIDVILTVKSHMTDVGSSGLVMVCWVLGHTRTTAKGKVMLCHSLCFHSSHERIIHSLSVSLRSLPCAPAGCAHQATQPRLHQVLPAAAADAQRQGRGVLPPLHYADAPPGRAQLARRLLLGRRECVGVGGCAWLGRGGEMAPGGGVTADEQLTMQLDLLVVCSWPAWFSWHDVSVSPWSHTQCLRCV